MTIAAMQAMAAASVSMNAAPPQPHSGVLTRASATSPAPAASIAAPSTSGTLATRSSRLSGTTLKAAASASKPIGMLIRNTHRQLSWTSAPPTTGPSAAPIAPKADHVPMAAVLPRAGTQASKSDSEAGAIIPAPAAWMILAPMRAGTDGVMPHSSDPAVKADKPATRTRRRPIRSAHRPAGIRTAANTMVYAFSTQDKELRVVLAYSLPMYGNARLTMNRSRLDMNTAIDRTPMITPSLRGAVRGGSCDLSASITVGEFVSDKPRAN